MTSGTSSAPTSARRLPAPRERSPSGLGLNAEIHAGLDYGRPRAWAAALRAGGWRALRYLLRGDNALRSKGVAWFGRAGLHRRAPTGLRTSLGVLDVDEAARLLEARGVLVLPVPSAAALGLHRQGED